MNQIYSLYKTTNLINNKIYYGVHRETKWPEIDNYLGSGQALTRAIVKYRKENFVRNIICISDSFDYIYYLESQIVTAAFIKENNNYNACGGGVGPSAHSDATRKKLSIAAQNMSDQTRKKLSIAKQGCTLTSEHRANISKSGKGKKRTPEQRKKMSESRRGRQLSVEHREKISKSKRGKKHPLYGKKHTDETRLKMSMAQKERWKKQEAY